MSQALSPATQRRISDLRARYPTISDFAAEYHVDRTPRFALYPDRCILGTAPTLIDLRLAYGTTAPEQWLIAHLFIFGEQLNIPNKMTTTQLDACAQAIVSGYPYLKCTELQLFLFQLQGGLYDVDFHGYVTPDKILTALRRHFLPFRDKVIVEHFNDEQRRQEEEYDRLHPPMSHAKYEATLTIPRVPCGSPAGNKTTALSGSPTE